MEHIVEMLHIRKEFPGVVANDDVTLQLRKGEIHALLGENGAGKSTLMGILFGLYQAERGEIKVKGKTVKISDPNLAYNLGIGMVHQHFKLIHNFTVTENIVMGQEPLWRFSTDAGKKPKQGFFSGILQMLRIFWPTDIKKAAKRIEELSKRYGLNVDPWAKIEEVSVGMQQRVEILKMLYRNAEVLIFDEPTAVLTPQEIQELMEIMRSLISEGKSIILITHKLKEIKAVADRCTVLRRGKCVGTVDVATTSQAEMAHMMVGREVFLTVDKQPAHPGDIVLKVENLSVINNRKVLGLKNLSLDVRAGEIVAVAGVEGNGQTELVEAITGLRKPESGHVWLKGHDITNQPVRDRIRSGMAHIPEDRHKHGLVLDYTLGENMVLELYDREPFSHRGLLDWEAIRKYAQHVMEEFDVRAGKGIDTLARSMSGGNQQKAIVGREVELNPELLIAVQPTRGLDVGAIEYIHKRLLEQRDHGKAVLLISLELDEVLNIADRVAVVCRGELVDIVQADETDENEIGLMMAGYEEGAGRMKGQGRISALFRNRSVIVAISAIVLGLLAGAILILLIGKNPFASYLYLFSGGLMSVQRIGNMLATSTTLVLTGLCVSFAFKTGLFNIGGAGQMLIGGLCATLVALYLPLPKPLMLPITMATAMLGGALWAAVPGFLKAKFNVHEVVSAIMMNWIAFWAINYIIIDVIKSNLVTESRIIPQSASLKVGWLTSLFSGSYINLGLFIALGAVLLVAFILNRTVLGYELKAVGFNRHSADYVGIKVNRNIALSMMISGALAGLAGLTLYTGYASNMQIGALPSQGYDGIAVALLGANNPWGVLAAAIFFGIMQSGKGFMSAMTSVPPDLADTIIATIIYFSATSVLFERVWTYMKRKKAAKGGVKSDVMAVD